MVSANEILNTPEQPELALAQPGSGLAPGVIDWKNPIPNWDRISVEVFKKLIHKGEETDYLISDMGRILSLKKDKERFMKFGTHKQGYYQIDLQINNKTHKAIKVHRLVGLHFVRNPENKPEINHKKGVKTDNRAMELEWSTAKENTDHAWKNGFAKAKSGTDHTFAKKVGRYKNEILLEMYDYIRMATKQGYNESCISECVSGKRLHHRGFQWKQIK